MKILILGLIIVLLLVAGCIKQKPSTQQPPSNQSSKLICKDTNCYKGKVLTTVPPILAYSANEDKCIDLDKSFIKTKFNCRKQVSNKNEAINCMILFLDDYSKNLRDGKKKYTHYDEYVYPFMHNLGKELEINKTEIDLINTDVFYYLEENCVASESLDLFIHNDRLSPECALDKEGNFYLFTDNSGHS